MNRRLKLPGGFRTGLGRLISPIPFSLLRRCSSRRLVSVFYHMVCDQEPIHTKHLFRHKSINEFVKDLDYLLTRFKPVTLSEAMVSPAVSVKRGRIPLILTFDDGFREMEEVVAPLLMAKGIPATFFLTWGVLNNRGLLFRHKASVLAETLLRSQARLNEVAATLGVAPGKAVKSILSVRYENRELLDNIAVLLGVDWDEYLSRQRPYLNSRQVRKLVDSGFSIGSHGLFHAPFGSLEADVQVDHALKSMQYLSRAFGTTCSTLCFPFDGSGVNMGFFDRVGKDVENFMAFDCGGLRQDQNGRVIHRVGLDTSPARTAISVAYVSSFARRVVGAETHRRR